MKIVLTPIHSLVVLTFILTLTGIQGCAVRTHERLANGQKIYMDQLSPAEKEQARREISLAVNDSLHHYRINRGDSLEVMYNLESTLESQDYRLNVDDEIRLEFLEHPEMNRNLKVRPDGKITLPRKGDIFVAGLKPMDLSAHIKEVYSDIFKDLTVTTTVTKYSSKMQALKTAIQNSSLGQAKLITVNPDGYIQVPLLGQIKALKRTVGELQKEIDKRYQKYFKNLKITLLLSKISGNSIFVFGEVNHPGLIKVDRPITLLQAIASVGGVRDSGTIENIKVLYWDKFNKPHVRTVNLRNILQKMRLEEDLVVADNSVIYVPKTGIAMADEFVAQYIRKLLLFNGSSFGVSYELNNNVQIK